MTSIPSVIVSPSDELQYRILTLDNQITCLLISDEETETSAVGLSVHAGSFEDPSSHLGMAHFLEHLLFMGSEKYPSVDHYSDFICQNGGSYNAFTEDAYTMYYHEIKNEVK